ncbi:uncharacterized protein LOC119441694 isoform X1 [Dermacentor silvarum]|uniref:uncharacterized protein LOC119441694 isoform X1 n=1 Tax=Dermacentor silvarum TaxID=543639 RepID=UPI002101B19F|nr:uncharacterized protein LOC119441694 isoform X1 [Dermacentor silvarum]XP_049517493.1 uncharacterized protein LOC119441694 isoform X1 [Dermacentor silvarum]
MKLTGSLVFLGVLVGAYGAVLNSRNQDNEFEDAMRIHYRIWGENPWDYPGNPPPIFPPDDFLRYSQIGHWWNQEKPWENPSRALRDALVGNKDDDADEYRIWGKFPWERPGNPPPFLPPADTRTFSQIGRWGNQDVNGERTGSFLRPLLAENKDTATFSQIGRWWNQEEIGERPTKLSRESFEDDYDEKTFKQKPTQDVEEKRSKFLPLLPPKDHKLTRVARSVWQNKPWEKPWNPPPFLPGRYPPLQ